MGPCRATPCHATPRHTRVVCAVCVLDARHVCWPGPSGRQAGRHRADSACIKRAGTAGTGLLLPSRRSTRDNSHPCLLSAGSDLVVLFTAATALRRRGAAALQGRALVGALRVLCASALLSDSCSDDVDADAQVGAARG
eukprot:6493867-Prymnesium_polylepis.1